MALLFTSTGAFDAFGITCDFSYRALIGATDRATYLAPHHQSNVPFSEVARALMPSEGMWGMTDTELREAFPDKFKRTFDKPYSRLHSKGYSGPGSKELRDAQAAAREVKKFLDGVEGRESLTSGEMEQLKKLYSVYLANLHTARTQVAREWNNIRPSPAELQFRTESPNWYKVDTLYHALNNELGVSEPAYIQLFPPAPRRRWFQTLTGPRDPTKGADFDRGLAELTKIEKELLSLDPRSRDFRELARKKVALIKKHFAEYPNALKYAAEVERAYDLGNESLGRNPNSAPIGPVALENNQAASIHRLPGTPADQLKLARADLAKLGNVAPPTELTGEGVPVFAKGNEKWFLAAEKFALSKRADPSTKLTAEEENLATLYENTVEQLRSSRVTLGKENAKLSQLASQLIERDIQEEDGSGLLPAGVVTLDGGLEFVVDRLRYLFAENSPSPQNLLDLNRDVLSMQARGNHRETWWAGEARTTRGLIPRLGGPALGSVANKAWMDMKSGPHKIIGEENVPNGDLTENLINGRGWAKGADTVLTKRGGSSRTSRLFDPAQRESTYLADHAAWKKGGPEWAELEKPAGKRAPNGPTVTGPRTVGWQLVAEVPVGESGNGGLKNVIRRMFWNEAHQDGSDVRKPLLPGTLGQGQTRIAQQSVPLETLIESLPSAPKELAPLTKWLAEQKGRAVREPMPESLVKLAEKHFGMGGEVDGVRGELVMSIEGMVERGNVVVPLLWSWDATKRSWEPQTQAPVKQIGEVSGEKIAWAGESGEKENKKKEKVEDLLTFCATCHMKKGKSVATFSGACKTGGFRANFFAGSARARVISEVRP